jgi:hypothetical protein
VVSARRAAVVSVIPAAPASGDVEDHDHDHGHDEEDH